MVRQPIGNKTIIKQDGGQNHGKISSWQPQQHTQLKPKAIAKQPFGDKTITKQIIQDKFILYKTPSRRRNQNKTI